MKSHQKKDVQGLFDTLLYVMKKDRVLTKIFIKQLNCSIKQLIQGIIIL